jgi:hypothetical protein
VRHLTYWVKNKSHLAAACEDGTVLVWDAVNRTEQAVFKDHQVRGCLRTGRHGMEQQPAAP